MGLPEINIIFRSKAIAAVGRGAIGVLAVVLKDALATAVSEYTINDITDIPAGLSPENKIYLEQALMGAPKQTKAIIIPDTATDYTAALDQLENISWNIGCIPGINSTGATSVASWVAAQRNNNNNKKIMMVLPDTAADNEGVINFAIGDGSIMTPTESSYIGYEATEYTARVAGIIAGLPLTVSPTYRPLREIYSIPQMPKDDISAMIDDGKLTLYNDGEKVKIARGVTSLVTTTEDKGSDWKKIKVVRILDMVYHDVRTTIEDHYIGSVQNSYENKLLLIAAINAYYEALEAERILDVGQNLCQIDVSAQRTYLRSIGMDVDNMDDQQIKEANTRDQVFLTSTLRPLDAIEDVNLIINL